MNSDHGASQIFRWFSVPGVHFLSLALSEASIQIHHSKENASVRLRRVLVDMLSHNCIAIYAIT